MKRFISLVLLLIPISGYAATPKIIPSKDMTYLGAFKLPKLPQNYRWGALSVGFGMSFYPKGDSGCGTLFVMAAGPGLSGYLTEVSTHDASHNPLEKINTDGTSVPYAELKAATLIQSPHDITGGRQGGYTAVGDAHYLPKQGSQTTDKLYWSLYSWYACGELYTHVNGMFGWSELDGSDPKGMWRLGNDRSRLRGCHYTGKYIFDIPTDWADTYVGGKYLVNGYCRGSGYSVGPTMYAFAPWQSGNPPPDAGICGTGDEPPPCNTIPFVTLLEYKGTAASNPGFNGTLINASPGDQWAGGAWLTLGSKRAIVFSGQKAYRYWADYTFSYPEPPIWDPNTNSGYHSSPVSSVLWFWDQDDITAVVQGKKQPYEPQPYAKVDLRSYLYTASNVYYQRIQGVVYDRTNGKLYMMESDNSLMGVIHVFQLSDSGSNTLDSTPPSASVLSLTSASKTSVTISWTPSIDNSQKRISSRLFRNGLPIAVLPGSTRNFTDNYVQYYIWPIQYMVQAVDFEGNTSNSNVLTVSDTDGGSVPITMFITGCFSPNIHETSNMPRIVVNDAKFSYTLTAKGGTPPYTWSWAIAPGGRIPAGLSLNSRTGVISGPATELCSGCFVVITVTDANGYAHKRVVQFTVLSTCPPGFMDRKLGDCDGDGYASVAAGGTDTNDLSCNSVPGITSTQPPPTNLQITGKTSSSVSLSWTAAENRTDMTITPYKVGGPLGSKLGETTYQVYYGTKPHNYDHTVFAGRATSHRVTGLTPGISYYFAVTALDWYGLESFKSKEVVLFGGSSQFNGFAYGAYYAEGMDEGNSVVQTKDGNIVMASFSQSYAWARGPGTEAKRMLLIKVNPTTGQEIWRRVAGPEGWNITTKQISPLHWAATRVIQSGTDLIVSGYRGTLGSERVNASLTRVNSSGNVVWDREFNGTGSGDDYLWDVVERSGGGFAAAGYGKRTSNTEGWLVLTNSDGLNATHHYYNANGKGYEVLRSIRHTSDGGYIMVGWTQTGSAQDEDFYAVKVTSTGTLSWAQKYDNSGRRDKAYSVEEDGSGDFWIFGRSQLSGYKNTKIWIVKVNSSGILQTSYTIGDDNTSHAYVSRGTIKLANGNFLIMGYTSVSTGSGYHGYVTEIDTKGRMAGSPVTIGAKTGYTEDYLFSGVVSAGGNYYYLAGTDNGAFSTAYDLWFLKLSTSDKSIQNFTSCPSKTTFYYDKDLDGHGNNNQWSPATGAACFAMPGYVLTHDDPDDSDPSVIPPQKVPPVLPKTPSTIKP